MHNVACLVEFDWLELRAERFADLRPAAPHRPVPSAPIDQQAVAVDAQHAALDLVGGVGRQAVAGAWGAAAEVPASR
jgi:hypothetical protein